MRRKAFEVFLGEDDAGLHATSPPMALTAKHWVSVAARAEAALGDDLDHLAPTLKGAESALDRLKARGRQFGFTIRQISDFGAALRAYARFLAVAGPAGTGDAALDPLLASLAELSIAQLRSLRAGLAFELQRRESGWPDVKNSAGLPPDRASRSPVRRDDPAGPYQG